jgi:26S proteasome regulatory subunit N5
MVELSIEWLEEIKNRDGVEKWLELVETLRAVTEGKVHRFSVLPTGSEYLRT